MPQPADPSSSALLRAAVRHCTAIVEAAATHVQAGLETRAQAALRPAERDLLQRALGDLVRNRARFVAAFDDALQQPDAGSAAALRTTTTASTWQTLSLVDDAEVEERLSADRVAQQIVQACEPQLRDLGSYMGTLLGSGRADEDRHPLRPDRIGDALCKAVQQLSVDPEVRALLVREFTGDVAHAMPTCYDTVIAEMEHSGVQPLPLVWRATTGHSRHGGHTGHGGRSTVNGGGIGAPTVPPPAPAATASSPLADVTQADAELMSLLRRLTDLAQQAPDAATLTSGMGGATAGHGGSGSGAATSGQPRSEAAAGDSQAGGVNLIHAHREALQRASPGRIDHMVIDVVGTLFDQILADSRVSPQMARQIARLQLPVLRVAMVDAGFFSSRHHPVRQFVNRIASLACPFDDFGAGPGKAFLDRVRDLVQEIIDGDFDQPELYVAKLATLEHFVSDQHHDAPVAEAAAVLFDAKESELRVQQRYRAQLQAALGSVPMDEYLRAFVSQVWSQVLVTTARNDGPASPSAARARQVAVELVMSVQPKGLPMLRQKFLMQLPGLMKSLNAGMQSVGWPPAAQKDFFGQLLPAHAESLKARPTSELDHNLLAKQLESVFQAPIPLADDPFPTLDGITTGGSDFEPRISDADAERVGLLRESAVDWADAVDIDLSSAAGVPTADATASVPTSAFPTLFNDADAEAEAASWGTEGRIGELGRTGGQIDAPSTPGGLADAPVDAPPRRPTVLDLDLTLRGESGKTSDGAVPSTGAALIDHVRVGFAYRMLLNGSWHKVRLSHVSPGRAFFVFTHGVRHQETVSLTARMLRRLCETQRLRAFENAYLLERATARARQQLAAIKSRY